MCDRGMIESSPSVARRVQRHIAASPRSTLSFSHSRHVARPPLVGLRTWCPNLIAEAAQSIDTFDLVPKKRVVPL